ncbi:glycoside hydrolase family 25 protein [Roseibacillus persicicus]|uniref:Lysozyme n=1 Tax=Roseibacillus persicicus TaxID=454148 RepID=A0A918WLG7_9BACT|nr:glycoside hydrolase family 25 protein [Roseibacillus persicicus]GHC62355.1 hypothetical protein GCM10007100_32200 [Roseibacillus persicicus]
MTYTKYIVLAALSLGAACTSTPQSQPERVNLIANVSEYDPKKDVKDKESPINTNGEFSDFDAKYIKSQGVDALIARATTVSGDNLYKNYKGLKILDNDRRFSDFMKAADQAGLRLGAYHLLRPNEDPVKQADYYLETIKDCYENRKLKNAKFLMVLDAGFSSVPGKVAKRDGIDPKTIRQRVTEKEVITFIKRIYEKTGKYPFYYPEGGASYGEIASWSQPSKKLLLKCPLWIPRFTEIDPFKGRSVTPWKNWTMHQYASALSRMDNKYYYYYHDSLTVIKRNNNIIPLELSRWNKSIPSELWDDHSYDASK